MTGGYKTQQKTELMSYLESMKGKHVTVNQIIEYFSEIGVQIGVTTIYRQLNKLVDSGHVKKYFIDEISGSCFEFVDHNCENPVQDHFHLKCENCDQLIHFQCKEVTELQKHVKAEHGFIIDPVRTVFYGICEKCFNAQEKDQILNDPINKQT
ncbi:MAG: Fur family transcriptional regulator [Saccharofermentanales bacterium]|jgi:Fur family ferric uptake transcriptional regulator